MCWKQEIGTTDVRNPYARALTDVDRTSKAGECLFACPARLASPSSFALRRKDPADTEVAAVSIVHMGEARGPMPRCVERIPSCSLCKSLQTRAVASDRYDQVRALLNMTIVSRLLEGSGNAGHTCRTR